MIKADLGDSNYVGVVPTLAPYDQVEIIEQKTDLAKNSDSLVVSLVCDHKLLKISGNAVLKYTFQYTHKLDNTGELQAIEPRWVLEQCTEQEGFQVAWDIVGFWDGSIADYDGWTARYRPFSLYISKVENGQFEAELTWKQWGAAYPTVQLKHTGTFTGTRLMLTCVKWPEYRYTAEVKYIGLSDEAAIIGRAVPRGPYDLVEDFSVKRRME